MNILILEGDGIGPEISAATVRVMTRANEAFGLDMKFSSMPIGFAAMDEIENHLPARRRLKPRNAPTAPCWARSRTTIIPPVAQGGINPSGALRIGLDLYANIRPARTRAGFAPPCGKPLDLVIVRENTEGFYSDRSMYLGPGEMMPTPDLALSFRKITRLGSTRIVEAAFALARREGRKKVTAVHKANVLRVSDGLFLECARQVAAKYPDIAYEEKIVDAMAALLIRDASQFDVIVTTNMFGDILSDEASELSGSIGLAASLNAGDTYGVAQAQHGSAPEIAGKDLANPSSLIGSVAMLLAWLGQKHAKDNYGRAAAAIEKALDDTIASPAERTRDLGGTLGTKAFTDAVVGRLK